jgi:hypothetical protein
MAATRFKQIALRAFDDLDLLVGQIVKFIHQLVGEQELANRNSLGCLSVMSICRWSIVGKPGTVGCAAGWANGSWPTRVVLGRQLYVAR